MLSPALVQKYDLSIRGGGEKMKIAASLGFFKQEGMAPNSDYSRGNFSLNMDYEIYKWLSIGSNISFARSKQTQEDGNLMNILLDLHWDNLLMRMEAIPNILIHL